MLTPIQSKKRQTDIFKYDQKLVDNMMDVVKMRTVMNDQILFLCNRLVPSMPYDGVTIALEMIVEVENMLHCL